MVRVSLQACPCTNQVWKSPLGLVFSCVNWEGGDTQLSSQVHERTL